ncbi:MAG: sterol desaturase family protein [Saprospiraceae bacterium]|nr:sterol desaturase family protein [Saprospiraceae bacterium]
MTQIFSGVEQELIKLTVPIYAILIITEMTLSNWQGKKMYNWGDIFTNLYLTLANMLCDVATRGLTIFLMVLTFRYQIIDASALKNTMPWLYWTLCVMAWEFMFYWLHRMEHSVRFSGQSTPRIIRRNILICRLGFGRPF